MKKIPTIFLREGANILDQINPQCLWVFDGEGQVTRKYDGTCCLIKDAVLWKRREVKSGKATPEGFVKADYDPITRKTVGWLPVTDCKEDRWHLEAFSHGKLPDGTYELCGEKIQGNPEKVQQHTLISHASAETYQGIERSFSGIRRFLEGTDIEGIVFHHPDGRMAKIKKRDYKLKRV